MTGFSVINQGINGDSVDGVAGRFEKDVAAHGPEAVIILAGSNDVILLDRAPSDIMRGYERLTELSRRCGARPFFLIPPLTVPAQAALHWSEDTDYGDCNARLRELRGLMLEYGGRERDVAVVDLQASYRGGYVDGVHMTPEGHAQTAELLADIFAH
jgi:lysophospholipase L1-like esterase